MRASIMPHPKPQPYFISVFCKLCSCLHACCWAQDSAQHCLTNLRAPAPLDPGTACGAAPHPNCLRTQAALLAAAANNSREIEQAAGLSAKEAEAAELRARLAQSENERSTLQVGGLTTPTETVPHLTLVWHNGLLCRCGGSLNTICWHALEHVGPGVLKKRSHDC